MFDVLIIGSGYSGSLLGWILAKQGRSVLIIDRNHHPRFAIGESSTPTADFLLAHLADRWGLDELAPLACWGTWKATYPNIRCGKKRGFSYYQHIPGQPFSDDDSHCHSLLVAASCEDYWSDTHWLRSDVDSFIAQCATRSGCLLLEDCEVKQAVLASSENRWHVRLNDVLNAQDEAPGGEARPPLSIRANYIIDASGHGSGFARFVNNRHDHTWMRTQTSAIFAHFKDVASFAPTIDPLAGFAGDDAAQHHLLASGWLWMLRMDHGICSVGLVSPMNAPAMQGLVSNTNDARQIFERILLQYPTIAELLGDASIVDPEGGLCYSGRLSRCLKHAAGRQWLALPVTYGFVDPLHSTGIAHSLSGVVRVAELFASNLQNDETSLALYERQLRTEIAWIDQMISLVYEAQPSFEMVSAMASIYFAAAVKFEKVLSEDPQLWREGFMQCDDLQLTQAASEASLALGKRQTYRSRAKEASIIDSLRRELGSAQETAFLMQNCNNRIRHSAAPKYAAIAKNSSK